MLKSKKIILLHIAYWVVVTLDVMFISNYFAQSGTNRYFINNKLSVHPLVYHIISYLPGTLLTAGFFYFHLLFLIPRLFTHKRYLLYLLGVVASIALLYLPLRYGIEEYYFLFLGGSGLKYTSTVYWITDSASFAITYCFIAVAYYLTYNWAISEKEKEMLKTENVKTELTLLKSQINPHFLFNTLGNIHSLTYTKSDVAPQAVLMLSDIMRYMLYDSQAEKVLFGREIEYIKNYVELQRLRTDSYSHINLNIQISNEAILIPPFILIPFVENVFKHGDFTAPEKSVCITITQQGNELKLETFNYKKNRQFKKEPGIGLENIKRRLKLLYPERHELSIHDSEAFILKMKLYL
jgi:hypothetical protein